MKVLLFTDVEPCPQWWYNFVMDSGMLFSTTYDVNKDLERYGAYYWYGQDGNERWLEFESEAHYTWFVLRWSGHGN